MLAGSVAFMDVVTGVAALLQVGWAGRLWHSGLHRRYPTLVAFLVITAAGSLGSHVVHHLYPGSVVYGWWWVVFQPLNWALYFCLIVEAHTRMLSGLEGFERLGQLLIYTAYGMVGVVFLGMMFLETSRESWAQFWFLQQRSVYIGLTIFTLFVVGFGSYFRLAIARNVKTLFIAFAMLFGSLSIILILADMIGEPVQSAGASLMAVTYLLCIGFAAARFSPTGEERPQVMVLEGPLTHEAETELTGGLQSLNNLLLRLLRS